MSTYANFAIQNREEARRYILRKLGAPLITCELTQDMLDDCINDALEEFSKYAVQDQQFLLLNLDNYVEDTGIQLPDNVHSIFSLSDSRFAFFGSYGMQGSMFYSIDNAMMGSIFPGAAISPATRGFSFVTLEIAHQFLDLVKMMTGAQWDFNYNERTKMLVLYPDPKKVNITGQSIIIGVYTIRQEEQLYGEDWCKKMGLAHAKILLGTIRKKFSSVQLLGGGQVDASISDEGIAERDKLIEELQAKEGPVNSMFIG